jgi:hypothetical protein
MRFTLHTGLTDNKEPGILKKSNNIIIRIIWNKDNFLQIYIKDNRSNLHPTISIPMKQHNKQHIKYVKLSKNYYH